MIEQADFPALVERAMAVSGRNHMRPVIEKELLHYDILFTLDNEGLLNALTFQGGTSLRLCYGSPRFSEDLDFTGGRDFTTNKLLDIKACIEHYVGNRYQLEVSVKEPPELKNAPEYQGVNVDKWQISIVTSPERRDLPRQRIKLEIANIPSYSREPRALQVNYDFLPDGYSDTLVLCESLNEVMADKVISLVNTHRYVRHRDIWDLRWLKQQGATLNTDWINNKIQDYKISDYLTKLDEMRERLPDIIHGKPFQDEMSRFIPMDVQERTLLKDGFYAYLLQETQEILVNVKREISESSKGETFII
ncbi:nucleotidyl transferase AbiEii/AbiGii toxin family protein [Leucothrix arctica]|uniref:Nucleotidyl transferase AbiEii/AbiGii toxin family protein n=1 Tax=Leucothrix arctica TaxID=1481894 RepID=A0A317CMZ9_9GAMM|nr:nucleotidyl transferase AbiEii/AbiGii toxin family protein [Leucothrix arctica]PWQ99577.1 nucleotidyl transferase AbiEii/AbiGii toxin family protein [Leucothrix arctica]